MFSRGTSDLKDMFVDDHDLVTHISLIHKKVVVLVGHIP